MTAITDLRSSVACRLTQMKLAAGNPAGDHLIGCLRCQAEEVRYRSLRRYLASLADVSLEAPAGVEEAVLVAIGTETQATRRARRNVTSRSARRRVAGVSSVAVAAATGFVIAAARRRARVA